MSLAQLNLAIAHLYAHSDGGAVARDLHEAMYYWLPRFETFPDFWDEPFGIVIELLADIEPQLCAKVLLMLADDDISLYDDIQPTISEGLVDLLSPTSIYDGYLEPDSILEVLSSMTLPVAPQGVNLEGVLYGLAERAVEWFGVDSLDEQALRRLVTSIYHAQDPFWLPLADIVLWLLSDTDNPLLDMDPELYGEGYYGDLWDWSAAGIAEFIECDHEVNTFFDAAMAFESALDANPMLIYRIRANYRRALNHDTRFIQWTVRAHRGASSLTTLSADILRGRHHRREVQHKYGHSAGISRHPGSRRQHTRTRSHLHERIYHQRGAVHRTARRNAPYIVLPRATAHGHLARGARRPVAYPDATIAHAA